jgi:hypothetical protein
MTLAEKLILTEKSGFTYEAAGVPEEYSGFNLVSLDFCLKSSLFGFSDEEIIQNDLTIIIQPKYDICLSGIVKASFSVKKIYNNTFFANENPVNSISAVINYNTPVKNMFSLGTTYEKEADEGRPLGVRYKIYKSKKDLERGLNYICSV